MFSRVFPTTHPKAGQQTFFIEKVWRALGGSPSYVEHYLEETERNYNINMSNCRPKIHTVRPTPAKLMRLYDFKVWLDKPYRSSQLTFKYKQTYLSNQKFELIWAGGKRCDIMPIIKIDGRSLSASEIAEFAINDGFDGVGDFFDWFPKDFEGYVRHWTDKTY